MGRYTPHQNVTTGNQYPPLLETHFELGLFEERGYQFRCTPNEGPLTQAARYYVAELPASEVIGHVPFVTVYRRGNEIHTPAQKITVPATGTSLLTNSTVTGGGTAAQALSSPSNGAGITIGNTVAAAEVRINFDTAATDVSAALTGRRILNVSLLYTLSPSDAAIAAGIADGATAELGVYIRRSTDSVNRFIANADQAANPRSQLAVSELRLGEINPFWSAAVNPTTGRTRQPWVYSGFNEFRSAGTLTVRLRCDTPQYELFLGYAALQVTYCDENRIGMGGLEIANTITDQYNLGPGLIQTLREPNLSPGIPIEYGDFTITVKKADAGAYGNSGPSPLLYATRTIDPFIGHPGVLIVNSLDTGAQPVMEITDITPQIALYETASANEDDPTGVSNILTSGHVYGRQMAAPVNSASTVSQDVANNASANDTPYPWLRFWARHHDAQGALVVRIAAAGQASLVAVITPEELDLMPEVVDGWREITVEAPTPLLVDTGDTTLADAVEWSSESGVGWEVLAGGDHWATNLENATYGGSVRDITVAGVANPDYDASAFWAQAPPTVTGLAVAEATQTLTPADPDCPGVPAGCVPTGLLYHALTWTAPISTGALIYQWGYYELQRRDTTMDADVWETIALLTHVNATSFNDYEARVGIASTYRIRVVHELGFYGDWSAEVSHTLTSPGVTGITGPVLAFTSNEQPTSNLAYSPVWERTPAEQLEFPEAGETALQRMYGRDYPVAFRPAERGGTAFTRTVMVNAAAVSPQLLADGFTGLRDLAWADLPYVAVRTNTGDRWLATIDVPGGTLQRAAGHVYLATVQVAEVASEPAPVEVGVCEGLVAAGALPGLVYDHRYAAAASNTGLDSNDLDIRVELRPQVWEMDVPLMSRYSTAGTGTGWLLGLDEYTPALNFFLDSGGSSVIYTSDALPFADGQRAWVRLVYDADTGGGLASSATFYTSTDGVNWTQLGAVQTDIALTANADVDLLVGAAPGGRGSWQPLFLGPGDTSRGGWNGAIARAELRGNGGTVLASPDFEAQDSGTKQFTDAQGNTWTVTGGGTCGATA